MFSENVFFSFVDSVFLFLLKVIVNPWPVIVVKEIANTACSPSIEAKTSKTL